MSWVFVRFLFLLPSDCVSPIERVTWNVLPRYRFAKVRAVGVRAPAPNSLSAKLTLSLSGALLIFWEGCSLQGLFSSACAENLNPFCVVLPPLRRQTGLNLCAAYLIRFLQDRARGRRNDSRCEGYRRTGTVVGSLLC